MIEVKALYNVLLKSKDLHKDFLLFIENGHLT